MRKVDETRQLSAATWLALAAAFLVMAGQFAVAKRGLSAGLTANPDQPVWGEEAWPSR